MTKKKIITDLSTPANPRRIPVSPEQKWEMIDMAIKAFMQHYPREFQSFLVYMQQNRTQYGLADEGGLKKASFRRIVELPIGVNEDGQEESLLPFIKRWLPGFPKKKVVVAEFLRRYPMFGGGEKY